MFWNKRVMVILALVVVLIVLVLVAEYTSPQAQDGFTGPWLPGPTGTLTPVATPTSVLSTLRPTLPPVLPTPTITPTPVAVLYFPIVVNRWGGD